MFTLLYFFFFYFEDGQKHAVNIAASGTQTHLLAFAASVLTI